LMRYTGISSHQCREPTNIGTLSRKIPDGGKTNQKFNMMHIRMMS
jgi:hypothetical protein